MNKLKILAVIPGRGGSKGIPRKNVRLMDGKPLITYSIKNALSAINITDIVVTTDDEEIEFISKKLGVECIKRENNLSTDNVTLDPVVNNAVIEMERRKNIRYDIVITLQPTSPLLKVSTLNVAVQTFMNKDFDTLISVVNNAHLSWGEKNGDFYPNYQKRLNRQQLPSQFFETGAFLITRRKYVDSESRIGKLVSVFEISDEESIDIDNKNDWIVAENLLKRKKIIFRVDGFKEIGMGHIYHCLSLAYSLTNHEILFVSCKHKTEGVNKLKESFMPIYEIEDEKDFYKYLSENKYDIVINDCLDTTEEHIKTIKKYCERVVTIEDLGEGSKYADLVINALYDEEPHANYFSGEKYICLRDEFLIDSPKEFSQEVKDVVVLFGGTDPSNLTKKAYEMAKEINMNINFHFITGAGYDCDVNEIISVPDNNVFVYNNVKHVSSIMRNADLAITSQGRTVYELCSLGVPSIVLAQNEREQSHKFAQMQNGFLNLGMGTQVSIDTLKSTLEWLISNASIRFEMRKIMISKDLKDGNKRIVNLILGDK